MNIPPLLNAPIVIDGQTACKLMLDLTVYLVGPTEQEIEFLFDLYDKICPPNYRTLYSIAEFEYWIPMSNPELTQSGRVAALAGAKRPHLEPVRVRIREGRAFTVAFWDGKTIDDPTGSWSFNCRRIHLRSTGLHAFVRFLIPLSADLEILRMAARSIAENVELYSGHGGLAFVYDPWLKEAALDFIYARARRFWGVDVEDINGTLPLARDGIKGVGWITLLGHQFATKPEILNAVSHLADSPSVTIELKRHGTVLIAGSEPVVGDQHRPGPSLDPYYAIANALSSLFLTGHPDFTSERFITNDNTVGWIRRFIEPDGWR